MLPYGLSVVTPSTEDPVSLEEVKLWCKVTHNAENELLNELVSAATKWCEEFTRRQFVTATLRLTLSGFPNGSYWWKSTGKSASNLSPPWDAWNVLSLPKPPLIDVTSVDYTGPDGEAQTFAAESYQVNATSDPGVLVLADGSFWPDTKVMAGAVTVTYRAGYGNPSAVPGGIKVAIKSLVSYWRMHRGDDGMVTPETIKNMLWIYRTNLIA